MQSFSVAKPEDFKSLRTKICLPSPVVFLHSRFPMRVPIDFNNEFHFRAEKINDEWTDWDLTTEFVSMESLGSQFFP